MNRDKRLGVQYMGGTRKRLRNVTKKTAKVSLKGQED